MIGPRCRWRGRERGLAGGRDEWRAAGVAAGQASRRGAPLTPVTERRRDRKGKRGASEGKVQGRGRGSELGAREPRQEKK